MTPDTNIAALGGKLADVRKEIGAEVVERTDEINLMILAIIARTHLLLIGVPGVAKSMIVREFFKHIDGASYYEVLLAKDTPSEQVLGPVSLKGLENDVFERITRGKLPESNIAFLDEIFKANSTVLNALLSIVNERVFHNNGGTMQVPLWSCIGASNEVPGLDRDDLRAFRDRFGATKMVDPVKTEDSFMSILRGQVERDKRGQQTPAQFTTITSDEIIALQTHCATQIEVPDAILKKITDMNRKAEAEGLHRSARAIGEGVRNCKALAVLNGRDQVIEDDLAIFQHFLWQDPEDAPKAYELTLDFAGAIAKAAMKYRTQFDPIRQEIANLKGQIPTDGSMMPKDVAGGFAQQQMALKNLRERIDRKIDDAKDEKRDTRELDSVRGEVEEQFEFVRTEVLGMGF